MSWLFLAIDFVESVAQILMIQVVHCGFTLRFFDSCKRSENPISPLGTAHIQGRRACNDVWFIKSASSFIFYQLF